MKAHREVVRGAIWNLLGYAVAGIGALILPLLLIKNIGREAYGVYSYLTLLLTQAYLLLGGLGESLAYHLANFRDEAAYWIRHSLGAALFTGGLGFLLWQLHGPETLIALLGLGAPWQTLLIEMRTLAGLALIGHEIAILLGWVPLAMGHRRSLVLLPLGQLMTQVVLPIGAVALDPENLRLLFKVSLYGGIGLGAYMWSAISLRMGQALWPAFSWHAWSTLWKRGLWQSLAQWSGLLLSLFERTIIGRWVSLSYMGLYSVGQYFSSKAFQVMYKATESILPAFGSEVSIWRRHLRLGQTVWFITFTSTPFLILLYGVGLLMLPHVVKTWNVSEMRLWAGVVLSTQFLFISAPLIPFFIGSGKFRVFYFYSVCIALLQIGATLWLVPRGYYYWAPAMSIAGGLGFLTVMVFRRVSWGIFWKSWVVPCLVRLIIAWGIALAPLISGMEKDSLLHPGFSLLALLSFLLGERYGSLWPRKRDFLIQVLQAFGGFLRARLMIIPGIRS